ncbi:MAG: hypothetical protein GKR96_03570 [Gammaproteobacteria bacterium]|nr:hypothetical protein [Gammaproteobacteria bacterium]
MERDGLRCLATAAAICASVLSTNLVQAQWTFDDGSRYGSFRYTSEVIGNTFDRGFSDGDAFEVSTTEFQYNQRTVNGAWHFANAFHQDEAHFQFGASYIKTSP